MTNYHERKSLKEILDAIKMIDQQITEMNIKIKQLITDLDSDEYDYKNKKEVITQIKQIREDIEKIN